MINKDVPYSYQLDFDNWVKAKAEDAGLTVKEINDMLPDKSSLHGEYYQEIIDAVNSGYLIEDAPYYSIVDLGREYHFLKHIGNINKSNLTTTRNKYADCLIKIILETPEYSTFNVNYLVYEYNIQRYEEGEENAIASLERPAYRLLKAKNQDITIEDIRSICNSSDSVNNPLFDRYKKLNSKFRTRFRSYLDIIENLFNKDIK